MDNALLFAYFFIMMVGIFMVYLSGISRSNDKIFIFFGILYIICPYLRLAYEFWNSQ